ncbi:S-methyl-5'-thioadenosine phosphorylase [Chloroflexus sp.]|uniref:S-methyl-5'-thioadenosine phosphorylase n=1 Tax=Chloroflexus sp. TaxID=1904827 RepID=UPI002ACD8134|nr:S-methyl-5'-thioadenosine phosphorylase [Chloroflexus sp.]
MSSAMIGVIGGSGLYAMPDLKNPEEVRLTTPFGDPSDAFIIGELEGRRVAFLPRHGRSHRLNPSEVPARANIYAFKLLGVRALISVSAVGSLREDYAPGHAVIPDQIFDRTKGIRPATFFEGGVVAHVSFDRPFCPNLSNMLLHAAQTAGAVVHQGGTLVVMEGPQFSTKAESEENRRRGHSLIGMTALPEAKLAREAEIAYATLAMVTDYDVWHPEHDAVTVEQVIRVLNANVALSQQIVRLAVAQIDENFTSPAHDALRYAIITHPDYIPATVKEQLAPIAGRYWS